MSTSQFVTANNILLHYRVDGSPGKPHLLLSNSLGSDLRMWDEVVDHLAPQFQTIRYDMRGHGLSDAPAGPYSMDDLRNDLRGLLEYLRVESAIIGGISVGGMVSLAFAAAYPERTTHLILADTGAQIGTPAYWNERIATLQEGGYGPLSDTILGRWFAPGYAAANPSDFRGYSHMLQRTPLDGYIATCAAVRDTDLTAAAAGVQAPALVLCGEDDGATPPALGQQLANTLPNGRLVLIPGAGHLPPIEQPSLVAAAIGQFLGVSA